MLALNCAFTFFRLSLAYALERNYAMARKRFGDAVWALKNVFSERSTFYVRWSRERPDPLTKENYQFHG